jgi:hypothetical protein
MSYRRTRHTVYLCNYHFVWVPKRRKPVLVGAVKERLEDLVRQIADEEDWERLASETKPTLSIYSFLFSPTGHRIECLGGSRAEPPEYLEGSSLSCLSFHHSGPEATPSQQLGMYHLRLFEGILRSRAENDED